MTTTQKPPSERQVKTCKFITTTLGIEPPDEFSSQAYWAFIHMYIEQAQYTANATDARESNGPLETDTTTAPNEPEPTGPENPAKEETKIPPAPASWRGTERGWARHLMEIGRIPWSGKGAI